MTRFNGMAWWRRLQYAALGLMVLCSVLAAPAQAEDPPQGEGFLLVADVVEQRLYVYRLPDMVRTGRLRNILLGTHVGTLTLPDGRILICDDAAKEVLALRIDDKGVPSIVNRVAVDIGQRAVWASADPQFRYFAIASQVPNTLQQVVNLIDLQTFENTPVPVTMEQDEEAHPFLGGRPLSLFVGFGGVMRAYKVEDLIQHGGMATPTSETPVDLGSHGLVLSRRAKRLGITTQAGFNFVDTTCSTSVCTTENVPWDIDGRQGGQNFRPRLAYDGVTALGGVAIAAPTPEQWADTQQDVHVVNMKTLEAHRFLLGHGIMPRFALSQAFAVFVTVHPYGDELHLLDVRPKSPTYLKRIGTVFLESLSNGPVGGQPPTGREARFVGITPDGRYAFATHGGDGKISVVDTVTLNVTQLTVPTALKGGGYIVAFQPGQPIVDLMAR